MERDERSAWLHLMGTPGIGGATARRLLARFGPPQAVLSSPAAELAQVIPAALADALRSHDPRRQAQIDLTEDWLQAAPGRHLLALGEPDYPPDWLQMADPPPLVYAEGDLSVLRTPLRVAVVGSRNPTHQGRLNARQLANGLGQAGVCVVSGLALGVDGAAHEGALEAGAPTVAIVGTGLDQVYPRQHTALAQRIAAHGLVLSEQPLGTPALAAHFPQRNRLIAGLSQATLVVEAALKSGSLITARLALEMGREVLAVPGSIHAPLSRGCHWLIRQGAKLVETAQDVLEELPAQPQNSPIATATPAPAADDASADRSSGTDARSGPHRALLQAMGHDPVGLDALQARCGLSTAALQAALLELEIDGQIGRLPGGLFQRLGRA